MVTDTTVATVVTVGFLVSFLGGFVSPNNKEKELFAADLSKAAGLRGSQHAAGLGGIRHPGCTAGNTRRAGVGGLMH